MLNTQKIIFSFLLICSIYMNANDNDPSSITIPGFVGKPPLKICWIIQQLNALTKSSHQKTFKNRLILHGPPGTGKSLLARKIAELTNRVYIPLDGPSIVTHYQGSGAEMISSTFKELIEEIEKHQKSVIVFIDEIDAIASEDFDNDRVDNKAALQQLWLEMDRYKYDPRIFIIVATNNLKKIHKTFLDRFGNNVIELKNPKADQRRLVLEHYFNQHGIAIAKELLDKLVAQSKGLSIRSLEDLVSDVCITAAINNQGIVTEDAALKALLNIKKKFDTEDEVGWQKKLNRTETYVTIVGGIILGVANGLMLYDRIVEYLYPDITDLITKNESSVPLKTPAHQ